MRLPQFLLFGLIASAAITVTTVRAARGAEPATAGPMETVRVTSPRRGAGGATLPYSATKLSRETIDVQLARNLPDVLTQVPGVLIQQSAAGQGSPFIRGFTGYRTLTLIDGVRYNNGVYRDGPNEYFSLIDFDAIESVDVFSGPGSVLYGSDAIGGTFSLRTRESHFENETTGKRFLHGLQRIVFGSADNSVRSRTQLAAGIGGRWGLHLGYSDKHYGALTAADVGKQHHSGYDETAWDARADVALDDDWHLSAALQSLSQDDVWRTFSTVYANGYAGTTVGADQRRVKDLQRQFAYARVRGSRAFAFIDNVQMTLSRQRWDEHGDRIRGDGQRNLESFTSTMLGFDLQLESRSAGATWIYGFDYYRDEIDSARLDVSADARTVVRRIQGPIGDDATFTQQGAYLEAIFTPLERLRLDLGGRYTHVAAEVGRLEDPLTASPARFDDQWREFTGSIRASYRTASLPTTVWGGISQAFRAPNIADVSRFGASRSNEIEIAATTLDPETFLTAELGVRAAGANWRVSATGYYTRIRDFITSTPTGRITAGLTEVTKRNSARGFVQGAEIAAGVQFTDGLEAWANLTWLEGELDSVNPATSGRRESEPLSRIMPLTSNFGLRWQSENTLHRAALDVTVAARADRLSAGDQADTQRIPPGGTPGYAVLDLMAATRLGAQTEIVVRLENVFDDAYRTHGSGINAPGRGVSVGLTFSF